MAKNDPVIKEHLGDVYMQAEQFDKALAAYEEAYKNFEEEDKKERVYLKINSIKSRSLQ